MENDFGIFIGLSCVPAYSNLSFDYENFLKKNINICFSGYKDSLDSFKTDKNSTSQLYEPIHFTALGNFDLLSICLIDDFYFSNFVFRPYNKNIEEKTFSTNFQFQVINALKNIYVNFNDFKDLSNYNFISICRLKLHPEIVQNNNYSIIEDIKKWLKSIFKVESSCIAIISTTYSWHELSLMIACNSLNKILECILKIRKTTNVDLMKYFKKPIFGDDNVIRHVFIDTLTTYGISNILLDINSVKFKNYNRDNYDSNIKLVSKLQIKTGHDEEIQDHLSSINNKFVFKHNIRVTDGRSDYAITFNSIKNYIIFWNSILSSKNAKSNLFNHIRKFHTNIIAGTSNSKFKFYLKWLCKSSNLNLDVTYNSEKIKSRQFLFDDIIVLEKQLKKLNTSKEVTNSVISSFTTFNDLVSDITLGQYILDLKPLLVHLSKMVSKFTTNDLSVFELNKKYDYHDLKYISSLLLNYVDVWQISFHNRFQDSKRFGYNTDSKVEFNGGVHQLIQSFDRMYKLIVYSYQIPISNRVDYLPVATYGSQRAGISSTLNNLRLNYFQLFQPEIFISVLPKEALNQQLKRYYFDDDSPLKDNIVNSLITKISKINYIIHSENNLLLKKKLFEFCDPEQISRKVNYIITYSLWAHLLFGRKNINLFKIWFWYLYLQTSENYNKDGTLRVKVLRKTIFDFTLVISFFDSSFNLNELTSLIKVNELECLLYKKYDVTNSSLVDDCSEVISYLNKFGIIDDIKTINSHLLDISTFTTEREEIRNFNMEYKKFTINVLTKIIEISQNNGEMHLFRRSLHSGKGIKNEPNSNLLINSHGGFFSFNDKERYELFSLRLEIINFILEISSKYKSAIMI